MKTNKKLNTIALLLMMAFCIKNQAQESKLTGTWYHQGDDISISTEEAYGELKGLNGKKVIVAVIDTGTDIYHEDLQNVLWVNRDEIPGNYIDDDNNGYRDDVHGWNFIGFETGHNVKSETLIETRIVRAGNNYPGKKDMYQKARIAYFMGKKEAKNKRDYYQKVVNDLIELKSYSQEHNLPFEKQAIHKAVLANSELTKTYNLISDELEKGTNFETIENSWKSKLDAYQKQLDFYYNPQFESRDIVGDDVKDDTQRYYGNNDVVGPFPNHGTHVSGIIAAERDNGIGIDGIANKVELMILRVVPDGDERDKDIANAILYAVNNGATIINMSFGKKFSWNRSLVDSAVKYAEKNDVLIVHSAGNLSIELDGNNSFPSPVYESNGLFASKSPKNWIEVAASTNELNENLAATFSNYSNKYVDLFAPGYHIKSTIIDDQYALYNGTSMAAPMVSGVAAVLRSYFPDLKAEEVKHIIMKSVTKIDLNVIKPSDHNKNELVPFSTLSKSGGVLNFEAAVKTAKLYTNQNTK